MRQEKVIYACSIVALRIQSANDYDILHFVKVLAATSTTSIHEIQAIARQTAYSDCGIDCSWCVYVRVCAVEGRTVEQAYSLLDR